MWGGIAKGAKDDSSIWGAWEQQVGQKWVKALELVMLRGLVAPEEEASTGGWLCLLES